MTKEIKKRKRKESENIVKNRNILVMSAEVLYLNRNRKKKVISKLYKKGFKEKI